MSRVMKSHVLFSVRVGPEPITELPGAPALAVDEDKGAGGSAPAVVTSKTSGDITMNVADGRSRMRSLRRLFDGT